MTTLVKTKPLHRRAADFARYRSRPLRGFVKHRLWRRLVPYRPPRDFIGLHVGSGHERLRDWINVDLQTLPEVDRALDVTRGLPFDELPLIFAEHFLEHLHISDALEFLLECHRALAAGGWLRLSTPNLDWVWQHVYRPGLPDDERLTAAMHANRAFYGWQHRFLWNRPLLERTLVDAGFDEVRFCHWGESELDAFRNIERHETYPDTEDVPHVLIAEARKAQTSSPVDGTGLEALRNELEEHFLRYRDC